MRKFIVHHKSGEIDCWNGFIIAGHYSHSLTSFWHLAEEAKQDFPDLAVGNIECRTVIKSPWCKGSPVIRFFLSKPPTEKQLYSWTLCEDRIPNVTVSD